MMGIGLYFMRKIKNHQDFYIAGRSLGPVLIMATVTASIMGGSALIGRGGYAYTDGMVSIAIALPYLIGMLLCSTFSGRISLVGKHLNIESIPQLMEYRFGKGVKMITALLIAYSMSATVGAQISATATVFSVIGGKFGISYITGAVLATLIFVIYTASSGLYGVVYTDLIQFFILILFIYLLLPIISVYQIGGLGELFRQTPPENLKFNLSPPSSH